MRLLLESHFAWVWYGSVSAERKRRPKVRKRRAAESGEKTKNEKKRENKKNGGAKSGGRSLQKRKTKKGLQLRGSKINKNEKF